MRTHITLRSIWCVLCLIAFALTAYGNESVSDTVAAETASVSAQANSQDTLPEITEPLKYSKHPNIYDMPYSPTASYANWKRLMVNTGVLVAGGATTLVILEFLPEESTAWSRSEQKRNSMWERYRKHFHEGPVWDKDKFVFNGLLHPYGGAAYYMSARSCGFNIWGSFLYSFCISTFFWEYGVECFMEVPSVQDLIITPVVGAMFGEAFYVAKRAILNRNYRVLGSKFIGYVLAFLIDPVNELIGYFRGDQKHWCRDHKKLDKKSTTFNLSPQFGPGYAGMSFAVTF